MIKGIRKNPKDTHNFGNVRLWQRIRDNRQITSAICLYSFAEKTINV